MADSKTLLITGASSGIGAATATLAVQAGWRVALLARSKDKLDSLAAELGEAALAFECDVTDYAQLKSVVDQATGTWGRLDAVFANAGRGIGPGGFSGGDPDDWKNLVEVNVLGLMYTIRATAEALADGGGRLLITSSVAGRRTMAGSVYGASKWAATAIGYNAREELAEKGIGVTLIEPGMVDTPFFDDAKPDALRPEDVAEAVLFTLQRPDRVRLPELMITPR
ncbi:MAG: SDR family oxidoreductase [Nannocystaceae bacterium]|nr:SDR family oxidoreductase [bacterium]